MHASFNIFAETAQRIAETRGTNRKTGICADYLASIEEDGDIALAARFLGEGAFSAVSGKRASVGSRTYSTCAARFCEIDYEAVFKPCKTALGSAPETIEKLVENIEAARNKRQPRNVPLPEIERYYERLFRASSRNEKQDILEEAWKQMTGLEIKYFIRILGGKSLKIGFDSRSITAALAEAFEKDLEDVRYVHMITGSLERTAVLCKNDALGEASFQLFHPLSFMLASPMESRSVESLDNFIAEEKFDGMRSQIHASGQKVEIYSRDLNAITHSFPEIKRFFLSRNLPDAVLDGAICVYKDREIKPFQYLQKRIGRKDPGENIIKKHPTQFIAFDLLYHKGETLFGKPLEERRGRLETLSRAHDIPVANQFVVPDRQRLDELFERAIDRGNEGLMLKQTGSRYEYGERGTSWLKVKKPGGTLDTVILYAHAGSEKRGGYYLDFTLGVSVRDDERYEEEFIPIGKAYGGHTEEDMKQLNERIKDLAVERYGPTLGLKAEIVVELEFDDIRVNNRTKANYSLRLPRFKAIRWGLGPGDVDTLRDVERLYREKINRKRLKQAKNPSFLTL